MASCGVKETSAAAPSVTESLSPQPPVPAAPLRPTTRACKEPRRWGYFILQTLYLQDETGWLRLPASLFSLVLTTPFVLTSLSWHPKHSVLLEI